MRRCWVVLCAWATLACGHSNDPADGSALFLGNWECGSGERKLDCGQGTVIADLSLSPPDAIEFVAGTTTRLSLRLPARVLAPGFPGGPNCELAFDAGQDDAVLHAESTCTADDQNIVVHRSLARRSLSAPDQLALAATVTTSAGCEIETQARCSRIGN